MPLDESDMRSFRKRAFDFRSCGFVICALSSTLLGCEQTRHVDLELAQYPNVERQIDLTVELNITSAFREYTWHQTTASFAPINIDTPLDGVLADNAIAVATTIFKNVIVREEGSPVLSSASQGKRQAVLTPRVVTFSRVPPSGSTNPAWEAIEQTVTIEWSLTSSDNVVVWVGAGTGTFTNRNGFSVRRNNQIRLQKAIDNAFNKSLEIMLKAPEISEFAKR